MRVKRGIVSKRKHNKIFRATKGYRMTKRRLIKVAKEAVLHAGQYAYSGRRKKKGDFRRLWITRISNAVKNQDFTYSRFISNLKKANIEIDRKILSDFVVNDPNTFLAILDKVKNL